MINDLDIVQWGYLLDPAFQLINSAGKPLTNGYIEVYYHGTRNKYYCASDFDGTLHPFKIPLDSLGSNIVLADPGYSYDIYIYNAFGSLVMSRYNVTPGKGGEGGGSGPVPASEMPEHWLGMYGSSIQIPGTGVGTTLPVPASGDVDYEGDFIDHIEDNKYIYLKEGLYLVECVIRFEQSSSDLKNELGEVLVYTGRGNANEDQAWQEDLSGPDANGNRHCLKMSFIRLVQDGTHHGDSSVLYFAPGSPVNWSWAQIQNLSIVKLEAGGGAAYKYLPGDYITIDNRTISVTGLLPESASANFVTNDTFNETVNNIYGDINNVSSVIEGQITNVTGDIVDIHNDIAYVSAAIQEATVSGITRSELAAVSGVLENDIQTVSAAIPELPQEEEVEFEELDVDSLVSDNELTAVTSVIENTIETVSGTLDNKIDAVSAAVPAAQVNADWNATSGKAEILNKPDLSVYATHDEVAGATSVIENTIEGVSSTIINEVAGDLVAVSTVLEGDIQTVSSALDSVSASIPDAQVQSDWTEADDTKKSYIQHKPVSKSLVAGDNIHIQETASSVIISSDNGPVTGMATEAELIAVSGTLDDKIDAVSAAVPAAQVNADWNAVSGKAEILNKPDTYGLVAGSNVTITVNGDDLIISAVGGGSVTGGVTEAELAAVSGNLESDIQTVSAAIPDVSNFATETELQTVSAAIPDVSNLATKTEVNAVASDLQTVSAAIPAAQVNSDWNATSGVAEILNKPTETDVIAGEGITITESASGIVISSTGGAGDVTEAELIAVSGALDNKIDTVSAAIPEEQELIAGNGIGIAVQSNGVVISATGGDSDVFVIKSTTTEAEVYNAITAGKAVIYVRAITSTRSLVMTPYTYTGLYLYLASPYQSNPGNDSVPAAFYCAQMTVRQGNTSTISASISSYNLQADWNETATYTPAYIKNKPTTLAPFNTAGITDIQVVQSLPASPVSSVLYVIPET